MDRRKELINLFDFKNKTDIFSVNNIFKDKKLIIFGTGSGYIAFQNAIMNRYKIIPSFILNSDLLDTYSLRISQEEKDNSVVVVTLGNINLYIEIYTKLLNKGFKNIIRSCDVFEFSLHHISEDFKNNEEEFYLKNKKDIIKCFDYLEDEISRKIFFQTMEVYLTHIPKYIINCVSSEQYFPNDIKLNKGYDSFINCGAYDGDTVKQLISKKGKINNLICFEPDAENYKLLMKYFVSNYNNIANNIFPLNFGLYSEEKDISFSSNKKLSSSIYDKGNNKIHLITIDFFDKLLCPTFINMDIEGAELEALKGSEKTIKRCKPDLAISVYHFPEHLWKILLYINSLELKYKFYLRNYSGFTYETILYATTEEK